MYECAIRISTGRTALAGMMVFAVALVACASVGPALAQTLGGPPAVVVDESVLDQLGPPPQTLPDVILQQQPQAYRPAQRDRSGSAKDGATGETGRLLPPPSVMPHSRAMLPKNLKSPTAKPAAPSRPQTARVPKKAPTPKPKPPETPQTPAAAAPPVTRSMPAPEKTESPKASVVPSEITPPPVSVPPAPKIMPPTSEPAAGADTPTPAEPATQAAVPEPSPPPVAETEMPKAPPAPAPKVAAPETPAVETPKPDEPKAAEAPMPSAPGPATVPPAPKIVPPTPPAAAKAPAETPKVAEKPTSPRLVRPAPPAPPAASKSDSETKSTASGGDAPASRGGTQVAALPETPPAEILDGGQIYRIPFGPSSSEISEDGKKYLDELAQRMKDESSLRLQLLGYAGSTQDSASKARRTSLFRALSVRTYLMKQGVRSTRMDVRALGNRVEDGSPDRVDAVVRK